MRTRTWIFMLSAMAGLGIAGCFPEYTFDLAEADGPDASTEDDGAAGDATPGSDASADGDLEAGSDAETDAGTDADAETDADADAEADADAGTDAEPDAPFDGGDSGPPPEPNCGEGAVGADAYGCVERPPTGWSGPVALYNEVSSLSVPACPALFTQTPVYEGHAELNPAPASCSQCSCSNNVTGVSCGAPSDQYWSDSSCSGACGWSAQEPDPNPQWGVCMGMTFDKPAGCPAPRSVMLGPSTPTGTASCAPSAQNPTIPSAFSDNARACYAPSSSLGCDSGFVCAPKTNDAYRQMCIMKIGTGEAECPAGAYSQKRVFYSDAVDTRACTSCQCGNASNVQCNARLKAYNSTGCAGGEVSIGAGSCGDFAPAELDADLGKWVKWFKLEKQPTGTCPPSGGQPTGSVATSGPVQTICCMPTL